MSGYVANVYDDTNPTDAVLAETATQEFQAIKGFMQGVIARNSGIVNITDTTTATIVFTATVKANSLGTNHILKFTAVGIIGCGTGSAESILFGVNFGGQSVDGSMAIPGTGTFAWKVEVTLNNNGATNSQQVCIVIHVFTSPATTSQQSCVTGYPQGYVPFTPLSVDTTGDQPFTFDLALAVADPSFYINCNAMVLEWL